MQFCQLHVDCTRNSESNRMYNAQGNMKQTRKIRSSVGRLTELFDTDILTPSVCNAVKKYDIFLCTSGICSDHAI